MVQREVADRFFAQPSTKAYGAVSVLVQLAAERTGFHPVSRTVFRPRPNVDSALVAFRRHELPADFARVKQLVDRCLRPPAQDGLQTRSSSRALRRVSAATEGAAQRSAASRPSAPRSSRRRSSSP